MKVGEIKVTCVLYDKKKNIRTPLCQICSDEAYANRWVEWLKVQEETVSITVTKQTEYGEILVLSWW